MPVENCLRELPPRKLLFVVSPFAVGRLADGKCSGSAIESRTEWKKERSARNQPSQRKCLANARFLRAVPRAHFAERNGRLGKPAVRLWTPAGEVKCAKNSEGDVPCGEGIVRPRQHGADQFRVQIPMGRTTISLAPADVKKEGLSFDLPIAIGMLAASDQLQSDELDNFIMVGELALTEAVAPVGILPFLQK